MDNHGRAGCGAERSLTIVRTAVCTLGAGHHVELHEIARPSLVQFATVHGADLVVVDRVLAPERPATWSKVVLLRELLERYDRVVWVDADAVVIDPRRDIFRGVTRARPLGIVVHHYDGLEIPNLGVMALRSCSWSKRFLERLWALEQYIDHKWWENAGALELLGYDLDHPSRSTRRRTAASLRIVELDLRWNSITLDPAAEPRIVHFPGMSQTDRVREMSSAADSVIDVGYSDERSFQLVSPGDARRIGERGLDLLERAH
jgi:hypothetical protein